MPMASLDHLNGFEGISDPTSTGSGYRPGIASPVAAFTTAGTGGLVGAWLVTIRELPTSTMTPVRTEPSSTALMPAEMISAIRARLGLTITETAAALGVERPTVYEWLSTNPRLRERNRTRLARLHEIAERWSHLVGAPTAELLRASGEGGLSLLDLLKAGRFDEAASRIPALAGLRSADRASSRVAELKLMMKKLGLRGQVREQPDEIDRLSGRRLTSEE